jgi:hypothetical protein
MRKTDKVFIRLGVEDIIIKKEDVEEDTKLEDVNTYFVGYEDEDGEECDEDGTYLKQ